MAVVNSPLPALLLRLIVTCAILLVLNAACNQFKQLNDAVIRLGQSILLVIVSWYVTIFISNLLQERQKAKPFNKAILITGCDSGFGFALAKRLDSLGFHVFAGCLDSNSDGGRDLATSCSQRIHVLNLDVTSDESVNQAISELTKSLAVRGTRLWAVVNNAGVSDYGGCEWSDSVDRLFGAPFKVNTLGTVRVTRACLPLLRKSLNSRVILVSSKAGQFSLPAMVPYSMSKHAVRAFGDGLRRELEDTDVHVSVIEPAMYRTPLTNAETNLASLNTNWQRTSESLREAIGQENYEDMRDKVKGYLATTRKHSHEVVDTMSEAILSKYPRPYYSVCGLQSKLFFYLMQFMPVIIQDQLLNSALITKFNKYFNSKA